MPVFPFVPHVPGVPPLARQIGDVVPVVRLLVADAVLFFGAFSKPPWKVVDSNGTPVLTPETFLGVDYGKGWQIANYPVEQGSFQSYDKVELPFDVRIRVASGSSLQARTLLINQVEAISNTVSLYTVITPERIYEQCNVAHVGYFRAAERGLGLLAIDIAFMQIRNTATAAFTNVNSNGVEVSNLADVKSPTAASPVPGGAEQAAAASPMFVNSANVWAIRPS